MHKPDRWARTAVREASTPCRGDQSLADIAGVVTDAGNAADSAPRSAPDLSLAHVDQR